MQACASSKLPAQEKFLGVNGVLTIRSFGTCRTYECKRVQTIPSPTGRRFAWALLRRGDAVVLGRQHVRNGVATLRTENSQGEITVTLPILPVLQRTLDAGPTGELTFICGANGKPFTKEPKGYARQLPR